MTALRTALQRLITSESRYAKSLEGRGEFGRAKLAWAALVEIKRALASVDGDDIPRLLDALTAARRDYVECWDDEDGIGTSTFARAFELLDDAAR
ncbi:MAG: hypothetical protein HY985_12415 [Magnetospirillum sp.]|nr:hypothetical protein [Magnetospirillum sp.]